LGYGYALTRLHRKENSYYLHFITYLDNNNFVLSGVHNFYGGLNFFCSSFISADQTALLVYATDI